MSSGSKSCAALFQPLCWNVGPSPLLFSTSLRTTPWDTRTVLWLSSWSFFQALLNPFWCKCDEENNCILFYLQHLTYGGLRQKSYFLYLAWYWEVSQIFIFIEMEWTQMLNSVLSVCVTFISAPINGHYPTTWPFLC